MLICVVLSGLTHQVAQQHSHLLTPLLSSGMEERIEKKTK